MNRPTWDTFFLQQALDYSSRSTCPRASVGAVIVESETHTLIGSGYNGSPRGLAHCIQEGCDIKDGHCVRAIHAEMNAVIHALRNRGRFLDGCTLYTTHRPCLLCSLVIIQVGISRVVFVHEKIDDREAPLNGKTLLEQAGVEVTRQEFSHHEQI